MCPHKKFQLIQSVCKNASFTCVYIHEFMNKYRLTKAPNTLFYYYHHYNYYYYFFWWGGGGRGFYLQKVHCNVCCRKMTK